MSEYSHKILVTVSVAVIIGLGVGLGISYLPPHSATITDTGYYGQNVQFNGTVLPFLSNTKYLGSANSSQQIIIGFYPKSAFSANSGTSPNETVSINDLLNWERSVGLSPGLAECPSSIGVRNSSNGNMVTTTSSGSCTIDSLKTLTTIGQVETAFGVKINVYSYQGQKFYANQADPYLPSKIANYLTDIEGLNNYSAFVVGPVFG